MAEITQEVSASDDAVTVSHTQESSVGRTEVIMGNTEQAMRGRLTKSQTGERDWLPYLIACKPFSHAHSHQRTSSVTSRPPI